MTEPYTPTTEQVREWYSRGRGGSYYSAIERGFVRSTDEFDRWFIREIEAAEYSGYLRAKDERN